VTQQPAIDRANRNDGDAIPADYDTDPGRFAANTLTTALFAKSGDVHPEVAHGLAVAGCTRVLDIGGGPGRLAELLLQRGVPTVVVDRAEHVARAPGGAVRGDATQLPFRAGTFDAAAVIWMLHHVPDPARALAEAHRVLRPAARLVVSAASRRNDPELAAVLPAWGRRSSFDAEDAPALVSREFDIEHIRSWDGPFLDLPDHRAVRLFLRGRGLSEVDSDARAREVRVPLTVTKRGSLIWARKKPG
jgi:SAM-dependent methyltransferase